MTLSLIGKKLGMTQVFDANGNLVPCTAVLLEGNVVVQVKKKETDGYEALQLGSVILKKPIKPVKGHFEKAKVGPFRHLAESRVETASYAVGQEFKADYFSIGDFIDVTSVSKGKGFQGVIKKYGFAGGPAAHGSGFHRHAGSTGMRSTPGRCLPLGPRPSRMGGERVTMQNLSVMDIDLEKNLILVKGAIPGAENTLVYLRKAKKKKNKK